MSSSPWWQLTVKTRNKTLTKQQLQTNDLSNTSQSQPLRMWHCAHSYFEKGCRKKCTRQSPKVLLVVLSTLFFNSKKNKIIEREPMNVRELNFRKVTKVDLTATTSGALYWSYPVLLFGIVACKFFRQPFSKQLYLHVFSLKSISDFIPDSHLLHRLDCLACTLKKKVVY